MMPVSSSARVHPSVGRASAHCGHRLRQGQVSCLERIVNEEVLTRTIERCRERNIILPTFEQLANPELIPDEIKEKLKGVGLWDVNPLNLFRITWKNEPVGHGGGYGGVNHIVLPSKLTGVPCKIILLTGKFFPTGAHKVGATYGPLVSRLVRGEFDPTKHKALWPSTGNYCRGGAFNSALLGVEAIAVLPEGMSRERFEWMEKLGVEVHCTPGGESNVKEVFDKAHELEAKGNGSVVVLNQFQEFSNPLFHYYCTGRAMEEVYHEYAKKNPKLKMAGVFMTQGSAGTLGCGEYMKEKFPRVKVGAGEAKQCPTLLQNGYGDHRIEGIGDKHVPWVHNIKNTDVVADLDDEMCMRIVRLFNEAEGKKYLIETVGLEAKFVNESLPLLGISGIANMLGLIKMAKYFESNSNSMYMSVGTDSMDMYQSRLEELREEYGEYTAMNAAVDFDRCLCGIGTGSMAETTYVDRKRMHNLKYFTWVEQQNKPVERLNAQWFDDDYWSEKWSRTVPYDRLIKKFNERTGLLAEMEKTHRINGNRPNST